MNAFGDTSRRRSLITTIAALAIVVVAALVFRRTLVAWFTGKPMGDSVGQPVSAHVGPFTIEARLAPDPPQEKDQALLVTVRDDGGKPVDGATVDVVYDMPAMGSMAEMKGGAKVTQAGDGVYRAEFDLPMASQWTLRVTVRAGSAAVSRAFQMTVGSAGLTVAGGSGGGPNGAAASGDGAIAPIEYPPMAFDALHGAMDAYDRARAKLAGDDTHALAPDARTIADALRAVHDGLPAGRSDLVDATTGAREAAEHLASASAIDEIRKDFAQLSRRFVPLVGADKRLTAGWHVFECPMFEGHPRWMQRRDGPDNPYMGTRMPTCGTAASWQAPATSDESANSAPPGAIDHYTCSMHPSVKQSGPGTCPICGMGLIPVTKEQQQQGVVMIDEVRRQLIGVRTEPVVTAPMRTRFGPSATWPTTSHRWLT
jgi:hypothetical protein